ncbi:MAG: ATP-binding protein [Nannocystaceae bacterium]
MGQPEPLRVREALDRLVNQFSDPLAFLRELIQNALDAGSQEVEVSCAFECEAEGEAPDDRGVLVIRVQDWGEGMTREVIETRLTRLFSSAKDGDRTKIGKFGIGFVSVFAIEPEAVCIDTSRDGESWRVIFNERREFALRRLDRPVDGTEVRVLKGATRAEAAALITRVGEVARFWCEHVPGEVRVDGELITRPLDIDAPIKAREGGAETEIVVAHLEDGAGSSGFYNRGLTLMRGGGEPFVGIAYKVSSPTIEHTLTRDSVIMDAGYERAVARVRAAIDGPLCSAVFAALEAQVTRGEGPPLDYLQRAASWHLHGGRPLPDDVAARVVLRTPSGAPVTLATLRDALSGGEVLVAGEVSPLTTALEARGAVVVQIVDHEQAVSRGMALLGALNSRGRGRIKRVCAGYCMPLPSRGAIEQRRWDPLAAAVAWLIEQIGGKLSGVALAHFDYPESAIHGRIAVTQREALAISELADCRALGLSFFARRRQLVVNADHPAVHGLVELALVEPEFAAYQLVKLFFLGDRLDAQLDAQLARLTMERRCHRSRS